MGPRGPNGSPPGMQDPLQAAREHRRQMQEDMRKRMKGFRGGPGGCGRPPVDVETIARLRRRQLSHDHRMYIEPRDNDARPSAPCIDLEFLPFRLEVDRSNRYPARK